jgi:hypothetical protein
MKKRVEELPLRTIGLAVLGFAALAIVVPEWARAGVMMFAGLIGVLAYAVDPNVRSVLRFRPDSREPVTPAPCHDDAWWHRLLARRGR